jgi:glycosyltransferase involved in cell wall biosynthesis
VSRPELASLLARARALIMPMVEDFGIIAVEAQAAGTPVIALGSGGALETVIDVRTTGRAGTGIFFHEQTPASLAAAVREFDAHTFAVDTLRTNALRFDRHVFLHGMREAIDAMLHATHEEPEAASGALATARSLS